MKLLYLPIDVDLELDRVEILSGVNPTGHFHVWDMEKLTTIENGKYGKNSYTESARIKYPNLLKSISKLPFTNISNVKINIQTKEPTLHVDFVSPSEGQDLAENIKGCEPSGYRILVKGNRDSLIVHNGEKACETFLPAEVDCYVLDQSSALHTVKHDPGRVIVYITGFIDKDKHLEILERSFKKYEKFAVHETSVTKI